VKATACLPNSLTMWLLDCPAAPLHTLPILPSAGCLQAAASAAAVAKEEAAAKAAKEEAGAREEEVEVVSHAVRVKCYTQLLLLGALDRLQVQKGPACIVSPRYPPIVSCLPPGSPPVQYMPRRFPSLASLFRIAWSHECN